MTIYTHIDKTSWYDCDCTVRVEVSIFQRVDGAGEEALAYYSTSNCIEVFFLFSFFLVL